MKKFIAFILAFICGFAVWFIPGGLVLAVIKPVANSGGAIIYVIFMFGVTYSLIWCIKSFYKFFLKKIENSFTQNFAYENTDFSDFRKHKSNLHNEEYKTKPSQNSQNHIDNILQRQRDSKFQSDI
ncbi:hypothetical protein OFN97_06815 [Campylobacter sp. VBCF_05 NA6]|uniref:hypothetical protein n=1 Tax=unclassified Campylobacter TaxID=2593542 RepID=UPI0022E9FB79|nr:MULTISPECIES: hypothetical protein [unclassified Campylobacter]MDA3058154.1 hypothetical protein [Campylobacter sp. VBCF_04 NA7]MDA3059725.1 hypothetical protein [Campylobacter sp. VBCF_05 NA6]